MFFAPVFLRRPLTPFLVSRLSSLSPPPKNHKYQLNTQGLAVGFVLLRVESLVEEGKL